MAKDVRKIGIVMLNGCRCRCGHEWLPRKKLEKPRVCPKCKSPNWDRFPKKPAGSLVSDPVPARDRKKLRSNS